MHIVFRWRYIVGNAHLEDQKGDGRIMEIREIGCGDVR
jgi:hypothetical protein